MSRALLLVLTLILALAPVPTFAVEPVRLILDTDMGNDIDDALALAMIHALETRGEVHLLAVTVTKDNRYAAPFIDLVNTFYGRPDIAIGMVHAGKTPEDTSMLKTPATHLDAQGNAIYPHRLRDGAQTPEAVELLTRILRAQPDHSVTIAQIGFSTNLARLVASPDGRGLVARKVRVLCLMAGNFAEPKPEYNVHIDAPAFAELMKAWPAPMVFSGFEVGLKVAYPYQSIAKDFAYVPNHPIVEAYRLYLGKAADRPNWDSTAVLQAIRPDRGYFELSPPGNVSLGPKSITVFTPEPAGHSRYLIVKPEQTGRIQELISTLVSEPPGGKP